MNETAQQVALPIIRLPGRVLLPHATRLLNLRGPVVRGIAPALRRERLLAIGMECPASKFAQATPWRDDSNFGIPADGEPVCICKVIAVRRLPGGGARILIRGVSRGVHFSTRHQHDLPDDAQITHVAYRPEECFDPPTIDRAHRCEELKSLLNNCTPGTALILQIRVLLEQLDLGTLCDLIADCIGIVGEEGLQLLAAANVELRSDLLLDVLRDRLRREAMSNWQPGVPSNN